MLNIQAARQLYPQEEVRQKAWMKVHQKHLLDKRKIEKLVGALRAIHVAHPPMAEKIRTEADYFERNAERMRYPPFRHQRAALTSMAALRTMGNSAAKLGRHDILHFYVARRPRN